MSKTKLGFSTGKGFIEKVDKAAQADKSTQADITDFTNGEWIDGVSSSGATTTYEKFYIPRSALVMGATYEIRYYEQWSTSPSLAFDNPVGSVIFNYFTPENKSSTQNLAYRIDYKDQTTYAGQFIETVRNLVVNASQNRVYVVQVETAYINEVSGDKVKTTKLSSSSDNKTSYYNLKYRRIR